MSHLHEIRRFKAFVQEQHQQLPYYNEPALAALINSAAYPNAAQVSVINLITEWGRHTFEQLINHADDILQEWRHAAKRALIGQWSMGDQQIFEHATMGFSDLADCWVMMSEMLTWLDEKQLLDEVTLATAQETTFMNLNDLLQKSLIMRMPHDISENGIEVNDPPLVIQKDAQRHLKIVAESLCMASESFRGYVSLNAAELTIIQGPIMDAPADVSTGLTESVAFHLLQGRGAEDGSYKSTGLEIKTETELDSKTTVPARVGTTSASFDNIRIDGTRSASGDRRQLSKLTKYHFQVVVDHQLHRKIIHQQQDRITFKSSTISYPFMLTSAKNQISMCTMRMFWCALTTKLDSTACGEPEHSPEQAQMSVEEVVAGLRTLWFKITRSRPLSTDECKHLTKRLTDECCHGNANGKLYRSALDRPNVLVHSVTQHPLNFTFFEWFYQAADLIIDQKGELGKRPGDPPRARSDRKISNMAKFYRDGLIQGFVDYDFSAVALQRCMDDNGLKACILRFSSTRLYCFSLDPYNEKSISPIAKGDQIGVNYPLPRFVARILNESMKEIHWIYTGEPSLLGKVVSLTNLTGSQSISSKGKSADNNRYESPIIEPTGPMPSPGQRRRKNLPPVSTTLAVPIDQSGAHSDSESPITHDGSPSNGQYQYQPPVTMETIIKATQKHGISNSFPDQPNTNVNPHSWTQSPQQTPSDSPVPPPRTQHQSSLNTPSNSGVHNHPPVTSSKSVPSDMSDRGGRVLQFSPNAQQSGNIMFTGSPKTAPVVPNFNTPFGLPPGQSNSAQQVKLRNKKISVPTPTNIPTEIFYPQGPPPAKKPYGSISSAMQKIRKMIPTALTNASSPVQHRRTQSQAMESSTSTFYSPPGSSQFGVTAPRQFRRQSAQVSRANVIHQRFGSSDNTLTPAKTTMPPPSYDQHKQLQAEAQRDQTAPTSFDQYVSSQLPSSDYIDPIIYDNKSRSTCTLPAYLNSNSSVLTMFDQTATTSNHRNYNQQIGQQVQTRRFLQATLPRQQAVSVSPSVSDSNVSVVSEPTPDDQSIEASFEMDLSRAMNLSNETDEQIQNFPNFNHYQG